MKWLWALGSLFLAGCANIPEGVAPVTGFEVERYMGTWYEIERIDNPYEGSLSNVSAEYRLMPNGKIEVLHRGFNVRQKAWRVAKGSAWFQGSKNIGSLKLSFGNPVDSAYHVLLIDPQYRYALVSGSDFDDLWILSREPQLDKSIVDNLAAKAKEWGFSTNKLVFVEQKALRP